jgi:hypothetical protein
LTVSLWNDTIKRTETDGGCSAANYKVKEP